MADIPFLTVPGFPHRVYRLLVDIDDGDRCREDWTGRACLCVDNRLREYTKRHLWQKGVVEPFLAPPAEPWRLRQSVGASS